MCHDLMRALMRAPMRAAIAVRTRRAGLLRAAAWCAALLLAACQQPTAESPPPPGAIELDSEARRLAAENHPAQAARLYRQALAADPSWAACRVRLAKELRRCGDQDGAVSELEEATRSDKGSAEAWRELGAAQLDRGRADKAIVALRRAHELDPGDVKSQNLLIDALELRQDRNAMLDLLKDDPSLAPEVQKRIRDWSASSWHSPTPDDHAP